MHRLLLCALLACASALANPIAVGPEDGAEPASTEVGLGVAEWVLIGIVSAGGAAALFALRGRSSGEAA